MQELMNKAIEAADYEVQGYDATEQEVLDCFYDLVDCQYFNNMSTVEEAKEMYESGEITLEDICHNIIKVK